MATWGGAPKKIFFDGNALSGSIHSTYQLPSLQTDQIPTLGQPNKYKDICKYISVSNFNHNPCSPVFLEQSCNSFFSALSLSCQKKQLATFTFKIFQSKQQNTFSHLKEVVDGTVSELCSITMGFFKDSWRVWLLSQLHQQHSAALPTSVFLWESLWCWKNFQSQDFMIPAKISSDDSISKTLSLTCPWWRRRLKEVLDGTVSELCAIVKLLSLSSLPLPSP